MNYIQFLFQILVCFLLSSCIGIERQFRRRLVGLRTIILVSLGEFGIICLFGSMKAAAFVIYMYGYAPNGREL